MQTSFTQFSLVVLSTKIQKYPQHRNYLNLATNITEIFCTVDSSSNNIIHRNDSSLQFFWRNFQLYGIYGHTKADFNVINANPSPGYRNKDGAITIVFFYLLFKGKLYSITSYHLLWSNAKIGTDRWNLHYHDSTSAQIMSIVTFPLMF